MDTEYVKVLQQAGVSWVQEFIGLFAFKTEIFQSSYFAEAHLVFRVILEYSYFLTKILNRKTTLKLTKKWQKIGAERLKNKNVSKCIFLKLKKITLSINQLIK